MKEPSEAVQAAHDFLENIDWELLEEAADMGAAAFTYLKRHPWLLIAAGSVISSLGIWQLLEQRGPRLVHGTTPAGDDLSDLLRR